MKSFLRSARFQKPLAELRSKISDLWRGIFSQMGRYRPLSTDDVTSHSAEAVAFSGDIPIRAGDTPAQKRLVFTNQRPGFEEVSNLTVTPNGHGWVGGVLHEKYSATMPGLRALIARPKAVEKIPCAYFIQAEHVDTFGDWMSEYLAPLSSVETLDMPVLLPATLAQRAYVQRDCKRLGLDVRFIQHPIEVEQARVIRQQRVIRYWSAPEVKRLRRLLKAKPSAPKPGSIVYLSRQGEASEVAVRNHPHAELENIVKQNGGKIIHTRNATLDEYFAASNDAETVIMDHGSAGYNMAYWNPKRVIEIVSDDWWMNAFLFFADSIGVRDYVIVRSDLGGPTRAAEKVDEILKNPIRQTHSSAP